MGAMQPSELSGTPKILGHYEVEHILGEGRNGRVYLGRDARLDRQVAIKVLRKSGEPDVNVARVLLEARIAASLHHRYICRVYDAGSEEGRWVIVKMSRLPVNP
jgi:serine/threonine-protein kinase